MQRVVKEDMLDNTVCCAVDMRGKVTRLVKVSNGCASLVNIASAWVLKLLFDLHPKATLPDINARIFVDSSTFPASHHVSTLISQGQQSSHFAQRSFLSSISSYPRSD